ncbi:DUF1778 domain-containing protein [Acidithiobacillus sp. IBUN Pt1247-S3]|uniref:type II toxin-antitoxin system TacA family antitoxin n=1 Tax=Acidithiobacillus sp. IBUN Pt1247-S3 TaxID=3166642 RepID=UPI0034E46A92
MPSVLDKNDRIDIRLPAALKQRLGRAASHLGMPLSVFLLSAAVERADQIIDEAENLTLSARDWEAFVQGLDDAERERPRLAAAAQRYRGRASAP